MTDITNGLNLHRYADDDMKKYAINNGYVKLLKGIGLFSIGAMTIGLVGFDTSNESKADLMYILVGAVFGSYGLSEGWKGLKVLKNL